MLCSNSFSFSNECVIIKRNLTVWGVDALKKKFFAIGLVLLASLLTGCGFRTVDQMYCIPRRTEEYTILQNTIEQAMDGLEFASPSYGDNQQMVQSADLDGDGKQEYLVFARGNSEKPLKILIFHETDNGKYVLLEMLQMNGSAFEQVDYVDVDGRPGSELVVGRRLSDQMMRIAAVFSFADGQSNQLINTIYAKFYTTDMDSDGKADLLVLREGETDVSAGTAVLYTYENDAMVRSREIRLSQRIEQVKRTKVSRLQSGETALYISSSMNDSAIVTDVLTVKDGELINLNSGNKLAYSVRTLRNYFLYMDDIDGDGVMELPNLMDLRAAPSQTDGKRQQLVYWYSIDSEGYEIKKLFTFHNVDGGWYLRLNLDSMTAERLAVSKNGSGYTFYIWDETNEGAVPLFTVYSFTGKEREELATENNRFPLYRGENVVFAGKLEVGSGVYGITQESLTQDFSLIGVDWKQEG